MWFLQFYSVRGDVVWELNGSHRPWFSVSAIALGRRAFVVLEEKSLEGALVRLQAAEAYSSAKHMWKYYTDPVRALTILALAEVTVAETKQDSGAEFTSSYFMKSQVPIRNPHLLLDRAREMAESTTTSITNLQLKYPLQFSALRIRGLEIGPGYGVLAPMGGLQKDSEIFEVQYY